MRKNSIYGLLFFTLGAFVGHYNARYHYKFLKEISETTISLREQEIKFTSDQLNECLESYRERANNLENCVDENIYLTKENIRLSFKSDAEQPIKKNFCDSIKQGQNLDCLTESCTVIRELCDN